nr:hypothetical protein BaRGS_018243 [Batillaria attramentaria]
MHFMTLAKYGLEKRVKELEAKLSTQQQSSDTQLRQLSGLEHKLDAMKTHVRRLEGSQSRLDKNVKDEAFGGVRVSPPSRR